MIATPIEKGNWEIRTLMEYKEDWRFPGKVYAGVLPDDLSAFGDDNQLPLTVIQENMLKNHGYYRIEENGVPSGIVSADNGVFRFRVKDKLLRNSKIPH